MVNSAFHPSGVDKWVPATCLGKCVRITSVGWQVKLCDPIWQVISRAVSHIMHYTNRPLLYFTFSTVGYSWRNSWPVEYHTSELEKTSDVRLKGFLPLLFNDRGLIVSAVGVSVHQTAGQNHRQRYELHLANHVAVCSQDRVKYSRPGQKKCHEHTGYDSSFHGAVGRRLAVGRFRWQVRQSGMHYRTVWEIQSWL